MKAALRTGNRAATAYVQWNAMKPFHRGTRSFCRLVLAGLAFLFCLRPAAAESVDSLPKPTDYVNDFAHVLSPDAVSRLDRIASELDHSKANTQLAVVTVHTLDGEDASEWASQLDDKWHMGKKGSDRGILVLLAVDDRKYRIEDGYGLEGILNDAKVGDIGRTMVPHLRARDYDGAILTAVGQLARVVADDAQVTLSDPLPNSTPVRRHGRGTGLLGLLPFLILFLMFGGFGLFRILFWAGIFNSALGGRRYYGGPGPFSGGGGWGGGGMGGGDGGGSNGGGFGGFGGGDFGGGGAGGSW